MENRMWENCCRCGALLEIDCYMYNGRLICYQCAHRPACTLCGLSFPSYDVLKLHLDSHRVALPS